MSTDSVTTDSTAPRPFPDPPRHVPLSLRLGILFGGFFNQFGWFIFGFGMIFYWIFVVQADFASVHFYGELETARGRVTAVEKMNYKVNKRDVHRVDYRFDANGQSYTGVSYTSDSDLRQGSIANIEFPAGNPAQSRLVGGRGSPMPLACVFVAIVPLVGLIFMSIGFRHGRQVCRLLAIGESSVATLVDKTPTNTRINGRPVYRFQYEFPAADQNIYAATASTHNIEALANEQQPLLYDPQNPGDATLIAHLPNKPEVDAHGQLKPLATSAIFWTLFLPTLCAVGHGGYALWLLARGL